MQIVAFIYIKEFTEGFKMSINNLEELLTILSQ